MNDINDYQIDEKFQSIYIFYLATGPNKYRYRTIILFAGQNIYKDRPPATEYDWKCDQLATKLFIRINLSTMLTLLSHVFVIIGPVYVFCVNREYSTPTGVVLPFMDPNSPISFIINLSIQSASAVVSLIGTVGLEAVNCFIFNSFSAMTDLSCLNMKTYSDALCPGHTSVHRKMKLRRIIVQLRDLEDYINEVNDLLYWRTLTLPFLSTWCVALGIFSQMMVIFKD